MITLALRTDKPEAELYIFDDMQTKSVVTWTAHRELSDTLHTKVKQALIDAQKQLGDIEALIVYKGPGSFTGIRIGVAFMQSLALANDIPLVGTTGEKWKEEGLKRLQKGTDEGQVIPVYGSDAHTTRPKH